MIDKFRDWLNKNKDSERNICNTFDFNSQYKIFENLINEGIILPINFKIKSLDYNELNRDKIFKDLGIVFTNTLDTYYDHKTNKINIGLKGIKSFNEIAAKIGHELIHQIQSERSKGNFKKFINNIEKFYNNKIININNYSKEDITNFNREKMLKFNFHNDFERMAYAYEFVKTFIKGSTIQDILNISIKLFPEYKDDKKFMKYLGMYYEQMKKID